MKEVILSTALALSGAVQAQGGPGGSLTLSSGLNPTSVDLSVRDGHAGGTTVILYSFDVPDEAAGERGLRIPASLGGGEIGLRAPMLMALEPSDSVGHFDLNLPMPASAE